MSDTIRTVCVDCPRYFSSMTRRSLRLDDDGHPHIAYGGDGLYYAWYDGAEWQHETVDSSPRVGLYTSLALDAAGYPHKSSSTGRARICRRPCGRFHRERDRE
jgi:hypothetical protein